MNSTLENVGKLAAAISAALLSLSIAYEWGYFYVIGGEFQKLESPSDYLTNAIGWLPYLILYLFVWGLWAAYQFAVASRHSPSDVFNVALGLVASIILVLALQNLASATAWPMFIAYLLVVLWSISAIVFFRKFSETANKLKQSTRALLLFAPVAAAIAYATGVENGYRDLRAPTELYVVKTSEGDTSKVGLLRSFERGILVRNPDENVNLFMRWEQVRSIGHVNASDEGSQSLCSRHIWSWLRWLCL